ncbi:MAG: ADP-ribosylglycohydrolase family protein [Planctomycetaceae bacterium]|nr:ADP-ribosylglycohydrolase family protein [Planctomycetaceae bacterium]
MMRKHAVLILVLFSFLTASTLPAAQQAGMTYRRIPVKEYRDKMKAGWIGQIAGVCWGAPTEFKYREQIVPEDKMPQWKPEMINEAFGQDDLYVEMTFLRTMEEHGLDCSLRQAGIDFANSEYPLWHANVEGRRNLRSGIAPPDSSHPQFSKCADDIDYQIEADYSGLIAPGLPNVAVELGNKFGRLMNYGDGVYAGMFVGAMYSEAFFETDVVKIIETALKAIPADSQYAEMVRDVLGWYKENPDDWIKTWEKIEAKYQKNPEYRRFSCDPGAFNIDAKINGAYILVGLLYGKGDLDKTITISIRCGQDSDCNPANAGGVLFTTLGFSNLPARFSEKLDETKIFSHTAYNFPALIDVCEKLARQAIEKEGGFVEKNAQGEEVFVIPVKEVKLGPTMKSWEPGPIAGSEFTEEEQKQIKFKEFRTMEEAVSHLFPGWTITDCGPDMHPGIVDIYGRKNVLLTHPKERGVPCVLSREFEVPKQGACELHLVVTHHNQGDWDLIVKVDGREILNRPIGKEHDKPGSRWTNINVDLAPYAGKTIKLELLNQPSGWSFEGGYWEKIDLRKAMP